MHDLNLHLLQLYLHSEFGGLFLTRYLSEWKAFHPRCYTRESIFTRSMRFFSPSCHTIVSCAFFRILFRWHKGVTFHHDTVVRGYARKALSPSLFFLIDLKHFFVGVFSIQLFSWGSIKQKKDTLCMWYTSWNVFQQKVNSVARVRLTRGDTTWEIYLGTKNCVKVVHN